MRPPIAVLLLSLAAPLAAQSPVPELPGVGRPVDIEFTRARRERLLQRIGSGLVVVPAAAERDIERDVVQDNDFRQDDYFFYLTGLETQDAWLVLAATPGGHATYLFLPERDAARERWTGLRLGPGPDAARLSGIADVLSTDRLDSALAALRRETPGPLYAPLYAGTRDRAPIRDWLYAGRDLRNIAPVLDGMRVVKDAAELARLRRAIAITAAGQVAGMQAAKPGVWEYQLEATVEYAFRNQGADRVGFPSIIGSGPNSTTFHYDVGRRQMQDSVRPGLTMADLNRIARDYLKRHSGDVCGPSACDAFFNHGLGHWLGMRVHDVGDYRIPLEPGAVIAVEPGIYLPEENLGVRIEDDLLVTVGGYELLSADAPRTTADIEAVMRGPQPARRAQAGR